MRSLIALILIAILSGVVHSRTLDLTVIKGATLIDGTGRRPLPHSVIAIAGDRISAIGRQGKLKIARGTHIIEARGKFIIPGLIDCHCHMEMIGLGDLADLPPQWETSESLRQLTLINAKLDFLSGVTTVRDLGSTDALFTIREEINSGAQVGPRIFAAGRQLVKESPGAYLDKTFVEFDGPRSARAQVKRQVELGAEWIKLRIPHRPGRPLPSREEMQAIVEEAHRLGRRVAVHTDVPDDEAVKLAVNAGVDTIEHNAPLRVKDEKILSEMARKGIALMPGPSLYIQRLEIGHTADALDPLTKLLMPPEVLIVLSRVPDLLREQTEDLKKNGWNPQQVQARFVSEMQRARKAGVLLIFGTDCGAELMIHGQQYKALYGETQLGSTPMQALLMATRDAAKVLGKQNELGTIERNKLADLVIVDADPLADLRNLSKIYAVMKGGKLYRRPELIDRPN